MLGPEACRAVVRRYCGSILLVISLENWMLDYEAPHFCIVKAKLKCHRTVAPKPRTRTTTRTTTTKSKPIKRLPNPLDSTIDLR